MSESSPHTDESVFAAALWITDPQRQASFVARACGDDVALREQVEDLLRHHALAGSFLERPPAVLHDHTSLAAPGDAEVPAVTSTLIQRED